MSSLEGVSLSQLTEAIQEYMNKDLSDAISGVNPEYDSLPESLKLIHSEREYEWLGEEKYRILERETQPDYDVIE